MSVAPRVADAPGHDPGGGRPTQRVVLDAMGVLYQPADDVADVLIPFARQRGCTTPDDEIHALYLDASKGLIRSPELWNRLGVPGVAETLDHEFVAAYSLTEGVSEFLQWCVLARIQVSCISNDLSEWTVARASHFGLLDRIGAWTISGDVGERKPQRAIFDAFLSSSGPPEMCIFVDDRIDNVRAAVSRGMRGVLFGAGSIAPGRDLPTAASFPALATLVESMQGPSFVL